MRESFPVSQLPSVVAKQMGPLIVIWTILPLHSLVYAFLCLVVAVATAIAAAYLPCEGSCPSPARVSSLPCNYLTF